MKRAAAKVALVLEWVVWICFITPIQLITLPIGILMSGSIREAVAVWWAGRPE